MAARCCFVCLEPGDAQLHRVCKCESWVHAACLARTVRSVPAHAHRCAICHHEYPIEGGDRVRVIRIHVGMAVAMCAAIGAVEEITRISTTASSSAGGCLTTLAIALYSMDVMLMGIIWYFHRRHSGSWRWWQRDTILQARSLRFHSTGECVALDDAGDGIWPLLRMREMYCEVRLCQIPPATTAAATTPVAVAA
jgi:hypothetical protein